MDIELARDRLENLLDRATSSDDRVFLTRKEIEALACLLGVTPTFTTGAEAAAEVMTVPHIVLKPLHVATEDVPAEIMVCVDFGTSFSKAFASVGEHQPEPVDLPIGDTETRLTTPSELFIDNGTLYFGATAHKRWDDIEAPAERLIDSIKQFITLNSDVTKLGERRMPETKDPSGQFSQRDVLLLYLAHLMTLVERALKERNLPINTRRRFTHPAWEGNSQPQNEREMRHLMAQAILLSRSAAAEFASDMPTKTARSLLDQLATIEEGLVPNALIGEPVREATAAGAGALLATREGQREAYLVLDIGAGTTDVAGFYCVNNPQNDRPRVFELSPAADAKNMAGNALDGALQRLVMTKSSLSDGSTEHTRAVFELRRQLRAYKETLFRTETVVIELATDELITVSLDEFLRFPPVMKLNEAIKTMVAGSAAILAGDQNRIKLVPTGGGANLPIVQELGAEGVRFGDKNIRLELAEAMPQDVRTRHPEWSDPYPQIAVALGGSLPYLPDQRQSIAAGLTQAPLRVLAPNYKS